eukprot:CAMPEP_0118710752 /NCGR_PEP_ID=MMETSP0800-20121206/23611_1 /TAXON_ID=210618 ORGANISM="Striatella unipunctata, Strain CCMP2910" /NCGR_SAMPLE_ID=MMETSP0800 /ASSEMBLY_ACC=CAM_ASM_000638 /LENGTH=141 /DNA_ID=CAMNT_0006615079 /DNA_START=114 /DNA_END=539 /DNA_ORIENTATION=+
MLSHAIFLLQVIGVIVLQGMVVLRGTGSSSSSSSTTTTSSLRYNNNNNNNIDSMEKLRMQLQDSNFDPNNLFQHESMAEIIKEHPELEYAIRGMEPSEKHQRAKQVREQMDKFRQWKAVTPNWKEKAEEYLAKMVNEDEEA